MNPEPGARPNFFFLRSGRAEPCLTSGGEAATRSRRRHMGTNRTWPAGVLNYARLQPRICYTHPGLAARCKGLAPASFITTALIALGEDNCPPKSRSTHF